MSGKAAQTVLPDILPKPLPEGWRWVRLGDLCRLVNGDAYKESDWSRKGIPIIRIQNLNDASKPFNYWAGELDDRVEVESGNVLLAWSGTPGTSFGAHIWKRGFAVLNQHIFRVDFHSEDVLSNWAVIAINHELDVLIGKAHGGVGLRHVTKGEVESLKIPLPPLAEQKRIAAILNEQMGAVERARAAAEARLEAAKALPAAYLRAVFSSPEAQEWQKEKVADLCERIDYGYTASADFTVKTPRFLRITDIQDGRVNWEDVPGCQITDAEEEANRLHDGDIVFARTGATTGKSFLIRQPPRAVFASYLIRLRPRHELWTEYLYVFFQSDGYWQQIRANARGGAQPNVNATMLGEITVPIPTLADQRRFAAILSEQLDSADRARKAIEEELDAINKLPAALLRRAFSGEL